MLRTLHGIVWGPGTLALFLAVGILCSARISLFQIFGFGRWWRNTAGSILRGRNTGTGENPAEGRSCLSGKRGAHSGNGISAVQSACTALAATVGTGNIAGVAAAILAGGPGAVFWMWVSAVLGMATAYAETELGLRYRKRDRNGNWLSGPMLCLERGLGFRRLGLLYAGFCVLASFGMGSMAQANAIAETLSFSFSVPAALSGVCLSVLAGLILAGGAARIARAAERLVPVSAGIYIAASLAVIFLFRENIPAALRLIVTDAFSLRGLCGGAAGIGISRCMRYGIARGVFSNEAGLGSLAVLNGGVETYTPGLQGQWAMFEVFADTIVCCSMTALVILCAAGGDPRGLTDNGAALAGLCFERGLGAAGGRIVSLCTALFAFATIIAWYYMGKQSLTYLEERTGCSVGPAYLAGYLLAVFFGCLGPMEPVWQISDLFNGLMAAPNLIMIVLLIKQVGRPGKEKSTPPGAFSYKMII